MACVYSLKTLTAHYAAILPKRHCAMESQYCTKNKRLIIISLFKRYALMMLDKNELRYQLALYYAPTIGPIHYRRLLHYFNTAETVFFADTRTLKGLGITEAAIRYLMQPDWQRIDQALAWSDSPHHHIITLTDPNYPYRLKEIHDPPPLLFIIGNPTLLNLPQLAMVGSRNPSP